MKKVKERITISPINLHTILYAALFIAALHFSEAGAQETITDETPPTATILSPEINEVISGNYFFTGTATDTGGSGLLRVRINLRNLSTGQYYDIDGNASDTWQSIQADLDDKGTWSVNTNFPTSIVGNFRLMVIPSDKNYNYSFDTASTFYFNLNDSTPPTALIYSPTIDEQIDSDFVFTGSANDTGGSGLKSVRLNIKNIGTGQYINTNGEYTAGWQLVEANLDESGNWSYSASFSESISGNFRLMVLPIDKNFNTSFDTIRYFTIGSTDIVPPTATITSPQASQNVTNKHVFQGSAEDTGGSGLKSVWINLRDNETGLYYDINGNAYSDWTIIPTTLDEAGNWFVQVDFNNEVALDLRLIALPIDGKGNFSYDEIIYITMDTLQEDNEGPYVQVNDMQSVYPENSSVNVTGNAQDDTGIQGIYINLYNKDLGKYWNGTNWQDSYVYSTATGREAWEISYTLSAGLYTLGIVAIDILGNYTTDSLSFEVAGFENANNTLIVGMRGTCGNFALPSLSASGGIPENTLPAIQWAFDYGADMVELDVRPTLDGRIVVHHDESLLRTTNGGDSNVIDFDLESLQLLSAGSWLDDVYAHVKIPSLEEAAILASNYDTGLWLDVKWDTIGPQIYTELTSTDINLDKVIFNVQNDRAYLSIRNSFPQSKIYWKWWHTDDKDGEFPPTNPTPEFFDTYVNRGYDGIELWGLSGVTNEFVETANSRGLGVVIWGTHFRNNIIPMLNAGVNGVVTCDVREFPK